MIEKSEKLNLTQALEMHEDILDDISDAIAINLTAKLESLPPVQQTNNEDLMWVREEVRKIEVEQLTEGPLKVIRRIASRKYYQSVEGQANVDRITDENIARAKEIPIEELYDEELRRSGGKLWGLCPWHNEKTGSFCIHDDNRWSCFGGCGHGDSIDYIQKRDGVDFIKAVKVLNKI